MPRYVSIRRAEKASWWFDQGPLTPSLTVDDHEPVDTGLLDADGNSIMRLPNPVGFGRDDEW